MEPCHMDRLPVAILQEILSRAACGSDSKDFGSLELEQKLGSWVNPSMKWPQVTELCCLQSVSKQFLQAASMAQTLLCRISPLHAQRDLRGLIQFLARARCSKSLVLTLRHRKVDLKWGQVTDWNIFQELGGERAQESLLGLYTDLSEGFEQLFIQTPRLEHFAVVWNAPLSKPDYLSLERAVQLGLHSTNQMLKALAASCPHLRTLALGDAHHALQFPCLAASLGLDAVYKPFLELRSLIIQDSVRDSQAMSTLVSLCPKLQQLEIKDVYRFEAGYPRVAPGCFIIQSETLEVLDVWIPSRDVTLEIRTPKLYKLALKNRAQGVTAIAAPNPRDLEIDCSSKVEVASQWQINKLVIKADQDKCCRWDPNGTLQKALQSCWSLTSVSFDTHMVIVGNVADFLNKLEQLEELRLPSGTFVETCDSTAKPAKLPSLKKLTVFFKGTRSGACAASANEVLDVLRSVTTEGFPALRRLTLEAGGYYSSRSVKALFALQKGRPELELVF